MSWAHTCDLGYALVGLVIVYAVSLRTDWPTGVLIGLLMTACYLFGGVKYRPH